MRVVSIRCSRFLVFRAALFLCLVAFSAAGFVGNGVQKASAMEIHEKKVTIPKWENPTSRAQQQEMLRYILQARSQLRSVEENSTNLKTYEGEEANRFEQLDPHCVGACKLLIGYKESLESEVVELREEFESKHLDLLSILFGKDQYVDKQFQGEQSLEEANKLLKSAYDALGEMDAVEVDPREGFKFKAVEEPKDLTSVVDSSSEEEILEQKRAGKCFSFCQRLKDLFNCKKCGKNKQYFPLGDSQESESGSEKSKKQVRCGGRCKRKVKLSDKQKLEAYEDQLQSTQIKGNEFPARKWNEPYAKLRDKVTQFRIWVAKRWGLADQQRQTQRDLVVWGKDATYPFFLYRNIGQDSGREKDMTRRGVASHNFEVFNNRAKVWFEKVFGGYAGEIAVRVFRPLVTWRRTLDSDGKANFRSPGQGLWKHTFWSAVTAFGITFGVNDLAHRAVNAVQGGNFVDNDGHPFTRPIDDKNNWDKWFWGPEVRELWNEITDNLSTPAFDSGFGQHGVVTSSNGSDAAVTAQIPVKGADGRAVATRGIRYKFVFTPKGESSVVAKRDLGKRSVRLSALADLAKAPVEDGHYVLTGSVAGNPDTTGLTSSKCDADSCEFSDYEVTAVLLAKNGKELVRTEPVIYTVPPVPTNATVAYSSVNANSATLIGGAAFHRDAKWQDAEKRLQCSFTVIEVDANGQQVKDGYNKTKPVSSNCDDEQVTLALDDLTEGKIYQATFTKGFGHDYDQVTTKEAATFTTKSVKLPLPTLSSDPEVAQSAKGKVRVQAEVTNGETFTFTYVPQNGSSATESGKVVGDRIDVSYGELASGSYTYKLVIANGDNPAGVTKEGTFTIENVAIPATLTANSVSSITENSVDVSGTVTMNDEENDLDVYVQVLNAADDQVVADQGPFNVAKGGVKSIATTVSGLEASHAYRLRFVVKDGADLLLAQYNSNEIGFTTSAEIISLVPVENGSSDGNGSISPKPSVIPSAGNLPAAAPATSAKVVGRTIGLKGKKIALKLKCEAADGCVGQLALQAKAANKSKKRSQAHHSQVARLLALLAKKQAKMVQISGAVKFSLKQGEQSVLIVKLSSVGTRMVKQGRGRLKAEVAFSGVSAAVGEVDSTQLVTLRVLGKGGKRG